MIGLCLGDLGPMSFQYPCQNRRMLVLKNLQWDAESFLLPALKGPTQQLSYVLSASHSAANGDFSKTLFSLTSLPCQPEAIPNEF